MPAERYQASKTPVVFVRLPKKCYDVIRKMAKAEDHTIAHIMRRIVEEYLEEHLKA